MSQRPSVTSRAWRAAVPAEAGGALAQVFCEMARGKGQIVLGIGLRVVAQAQFQWIETEPLRQLVHRAFKRHQADGVARRAHRIRARQVQLGEAMAGEPVGRGVERAGREHNRLDVLVEAAVCTSASWP